MRKASAALETVGAGLSGASPSAASTGFTHGQPPSFMARAMGAAWASPNPWARSASSASSAPDTASRDSASRSSVPGSARFNASARPRGVGSTKRAGRTKANSSNTSKAGKGLMPSRRAVVPA